jgi:hypothetical protein
MRSLLVALLLGAATLGLVGMTPSSAEAQWRRGYWYGPAYANWQTHNNLQALLDYHQANSIYGLYGAPYAYSSPGYYSYGYRRPYYRYSYGPGYYNYWYEPGYYNYSYQAPYYGY